MKRGLSIEHVMPCVFRLVRKHADSMITSVIDVVALSQQPARSRREMAARSRCRDRTVNGMFPTRAFTDAGLE
jgi:hypothetical protein